MTSAQHRSMTALAAPSSGAPEWKGGAPHGMWWVAWRQHRLQVTAALGLMVVLAVAMVIFRAVVVAAFTAAGCDLSAPQCSDADGRDLWYNNGFSTWSPLLHVAMMAMPIALGVFGGAPMFTREFAHGTHVLALTQSVGRRRWWTAKIVVAVVPLLAGLLILGFLMEWVDNVVGYTAHRSLNPSEFATRAIIPASFGLVSFAIGVVAGIVIRSTVGALVAGLLVSIAAFASLVIVQPYVLPADRQVTPFDAHSPGFGYTSLDSGQDVLWRGAGYLDASGHKLSGSIMSGCYQTANNAGLAAAGFPQQALGEGSANGPVAAMPSNAYETPEYQDAFNRAIVDCGKSKGIAVSYQDYLPGSMLWPLRWAMTGICAVLAALFLALGAWRLRWAVSKR